MTNVVRCRRVGLWAVAALLAMQAGTASALSFTLPWDEESQIEGVLNTTITAGAAWRTEERSDDLVGKANLDPDVCGRLPDGRTFYQSCQGLFRTQSFPAERLSEVPGQFTPNADDGNLNYGKGDLVQAPLKITQDLTLSLGDFGIFLKGLYFYDFVNNDFTENHPNRITSENLLQVGNVSKPGLELVPVGLPLPVSVLVVRNDSQPCPAERNPDGGPCGIVYGKGGRVRNKRSDAETLRQIGTDLQLMDAYFYGRGPLWGDKEFTFKVGRQALNWGESTLLAFDSINTVNPVNANNFYRTGFQVEEVFQPVGMVFASMEPFENTTLEVFYQYEWRPLEAPAPGSYLSFIDLGSNNAIDYASVTFGGGPEDPESIAALLDNPLSGITNTSTTVQRLRDNEPQDGGQYGLSLRYYAEWLNNGTELGFYFTNTHSRNPYVSVYSVDEACSKNSTNTVGFLLDCPDVPLLHSVLQPNDPYGATSDITNFDTLKLQFEYPEDIQMFGLSFNTTAGEFSLQGEVAYRPDAPLQVDVEDLVFAGFGPTLTNCHLPESGCAGTGNVSGVLTGLLGQLGGSPVQALVNQLLDGLSGLGLPLDLIGGIGTYRDPGSCAQLNGQPVTLTDTLCLYPGSDFVTDANGTAGGFNDTFDLLVGHAPGSGRSFPSFIVPYRGGIVGTNPANSYIRGWENFDTYQFNLGGTYVAGATDNPFGADQILVLFETGATWVPDLPPLDELQLEAPGTYLHASAGADGSGADGSRQACSTNPACSFGADGLRFNPHQQDLGGYPDKFSWGYDIITLIRYESVLPGISLQPQIIWKHDVQGTAPGLVGNFIEGRKTAAVTVEVRYKSMLSFNFGYTWFFGGGVYNLNHDRDFAQTFVKLQF